MCVSILLVLCVACLIVDDDSWLVAFMADGFRTIITWRGDMGLVSGVLGFMVFLRSVSEVTLILVFGYIIPVMETLAAVRIHPDGHPMADIKIDSLMGMWTGIVCLEAILIPFSVIWGQDYEERNVGLVRVAYLAVLTLDLFHSRATVLSAACSIGNRVIQTLKSITQWQNNRREVENLVMNVH